MVANFTLYIYIYIYIYIKMNRSTKRFIFFKELFILFLNTWMFPACCFHQRIFSKFRVFFFYLDVAQGDMNGTSNKTWIHSCMFVIRMFFQVLYRFIERSLFSVRILFLPLILSFLFLKCVSWLFHILEISMKRH